MSSMALGTPEAQRTTGLPHATESVVETEMFSPRSAAAVALSSLTRHGTLSIRPRSLSTCLPSPSRPTTPEEVLPPEIATPPAPSHCSETAPGVEADDVTVAPPPSTLNASMTNPSPPTTTPVTTLLHPAHLGHHHHLPPAHFASTYPTHYGTANPPPPTMRPVSITSAAHSWTPRMPLRPPQPPPELRMGPIPVVPHYHPHYNAWDPQVQPPSTYPYHYYNANTAAATNMTTGITDSASHKRSSGEGQSFVTPTPKKNKTGDTSYNRKKKSLGLLAETFLGRFTEASVGTEVYIDQLATQLSVERRRIYDVVNILESLRIVEKKGKNAYVWMGTTHLPRMFAILQHDAIFEHAHDALENGIIVERPSDEEIHAAKANQHHKEAKSLSRLSQLYLRCYLVGHKTLSLPEASDKIHGESTSMEDLAALGCKNRCDVPHDPKEFQQAAMRGLKTKIRRLYDIANVFISMGLLVKVDERYTPMQARRPRFSWCFRLSAKEIHAIYQDMPLIMKIERNPFEPDEALTPFIRRVPSSVSCTPPEPPSTASSVSSSCDRSVARSTNKDHTSDNTVLANIHLKGGAVDLFMPKKPKEALGLLAENFLVRWTDASVGTEINIDQIAGQHSVEGHLINDLMNIFESLRIVEKDRDNTYVWLGMGHLPRFLASLQHEAILQHAQDALDNGVITDKPPKEEIQPVRENRHQEVKSVSRLSHLYLQCYLVGHNTLSLGEAAEKIDISEDPELLRGQKSKISCLYDVADVFIAMGLLSKIDECSTAIEVKRYRFSWCYHLSAKEIRDIYGAMSLATIIERNPFEPDEKGSPCIRRVLSPVRDGHKGDTVFANIHVMGGAVDSSETKKHRDDTETSFRRVALPI